MISFFLDLKHRLSGKECEHLFDYVGTNKNDSADLYK